MITESLFYFANISATKAQILMKFSVVVCYYLVSLSFEFHDDPCINTHVRVVNACTRDKSCGGQKKLIHLPDGALIIMPQK